jgi:hypothetical protein
MSWMAAAVYRPEEWRDFFVMVGGAAAVLTGWCSSRCRCAWR